MARTADLPIHFRTGLRAVGIVGGRPVWPIFGGDESDDAAAQAAAKAKADADAAAKAAADAAAAEKARNERGYPDSTPLEQMTGEQREAYWKHHSRKHEDAAKAYSALGLTPEQVKELKERNEKLEYDLSSDAEKKAADAKKAAEEATRGVMLPAVIEAKLDAAAARAGVSEEDLAKALQFADTSKLLGADGQPDTDKVKAFIQTIKPDTGSQRTAPSTRGYGNRQPGDTTGSRAAAGLAEAQRRGFIKAS